MSNSETNVTRKPILTEADLKQHQGKKFFITCKEANTLCLQESKNIRFNPLDLIENKPFCDALHAGDLTQLEGVTLYDVMQVSASNGKDVPKTVQYITNKINFTDMSKSLCEIVSGLFLYTAQQSHTVGKSWKKAGKADPTMVEALTCGQVLEVGVKDLYGVYEGYNFSTSTSSPKVTIDKKVAQVKELLSNGKLAEAERALAQYVAMSENALFADMFKPVIAEAIKTAIAEYKAAQKK